MKTVKELKKMLAAMPDDSIVVMSCDAEGNGHSPLADISEGNYEADTTWSGTYYGVEDDGEGVKCVALWPTN